MIRYISGLKKLHIFIICIILVAVFAAFGSKGLVDVYRLKKERDAMLGYNKSIELQNRQLEKEIGLLRTDKQYIEHVAKNELGLIGRNEVIYKLPRPAPKATD